MVGFAVVLTIVGVALIVLGIVVYGNGADVNPTGQNEGERVRDGFAQVRYRSMLGLMPRSVKVVTDSDAGRQERLQAAGAFAAMVGIVVLILAVLAVVAAVI
jgi:uncharacterized membrane protein